MNETSTGRLEAGTTIVSGHAMAQAATPWLLLVGLWFAATLIASFFASILADSAVAGDLFIPRSHDSFYHARRILDAAVGERGFYEFDERIHPPDGTWIPWPWGYDYLLAQLTRFAVWLRPGMDPLAFLVWAPVAWIGVNAALFLGAASALGLSLGMRGLVLLAFALSPLTQLLHGVGMIDHHFVEHSFVLAVVFVGLKWFRRLESRRLALALGFVLGMAPAFHNGLFLLQLMPLLAATVLWLRGTAIPRRPAVSFAGALVAGIVLAVSPSSALWAGRFEFGLLSWFHCYVSICTALVFLFLSWRPRSQKTVAGLALLAAGLSVPLLAQLIQGAAFATGDVDVLSNIGEARSPFRMLVDTPYATVTYFGWWLVALPLLWLHAAYRALTDRDPSKVFFAVVSIVGLGLMALQFRFHYFGYFALVAGVFLLVDELRERWRRPEGLVFLGAFVVLALVLQPALRHRLFVVQPLGGDERYNLSLSQHLALSAACEADPGLVLASVTDGAPILFHTECDVFAINFILGDAEEARYAEVRSLMTQSPAELMRHDPPIRYLFARVEEFSRPGPNGASVLNTSLPIASELLASEQLPDGFELIFSLDSLPREGAAPVPYARLYRLGLPVTANDSR